MALKLVALITDSSFEMNTFTQHIRSLADCEEVSTRRTKESMRADGFKSIVVRGSSEETDGHGTLYVKDVTKVLRHQVEACRREDITFRPKSEDGTSRVVPPCMRTEYIRNCYDEVKKEVMGSTESGAV